MSENYLPLFRKYRPQSFKDLIGQENLVKALSNAIELKRIANAYLFCGPRGTGKTSSARIFAKSLNCENGPTLTPCQTCASCIDITNATGMDVIEIDAATNRGVEGAEELIQQAHYAPVGGKYKIFIIDEVHMLTAAAFNALLKTFEEPPENVIFILATTEPHKVLETIVSRCQRFDFRRITTADITKRLREISDLEKINITDDALLTIAKNVSGGMRDSLALLDQVSILGATEEITKETIEELLGKVTFDRLFNLLGTILNKDIENSLKLTEEIYSKGSEPRNLCENFIEFLRNTVVVLNSKNPLEAGSFTTLAKGDIEKIANSDFDKNECQRVLDTAIEYYKEVKFATNPYLWVELLIIQAAKEYTETAVIKTVEATVKPAPKVEIKPEPRVETLQNNTSKIEEIKAKLSDLKEEKIETETPKKEAKSEQMPEIKPAFEPPADEIVEIINIEKEEPKEAEQNQDEFSIWSNIVGAIESVPARFFYSGMAKLVKIEENRITLAFINQNVINQAKADLKHNALVEAEKKAMGGKYTFEFIQLNPSIKPIEGKFKTPAAQSIQAQNPKTAYSTAPSAPKKEEPKKEAELDEETKLKMASYSPKVKEMLEAFNGKIID